MLASCWVWRVAGSLSHSFIHSCEQQEAHLTGEGTISGKCTLSKSGPQCYEVTRPEPLQLSELPGTQGSQRVLANVNFWDFPGGKMDKNLPANVENMDGSLVQEDPTCLEATKPVHHNYWACTLDLKSCNNGAHTGHNEVDHASLSEKHIPAPVYVFGGAVHISGQSL